MKIWLPVKSASWGGVRFLPGNGWLGSWDECRTVCEQLNSEGSAAAAAARKLAVEHRLAEIAAIAAVGINPTIGELPDSKVSFVPWTPAEVPHTPHYADWPADGVVWLISTPSRPPQYEDEDEYKGQDEDAGRANEPDGLLRLYGLMASWKPTRQIAFDEMLTQLDASPWVHERTLQSVEQTWQRDVHHFEIRQQEIEAVTAAGLQPSFGPLPVPVRPFIETDYGRWRDQRLDAHPDVQVVGVGRRSV